MTARLHASRPARLWRGFTLIELLVVIAIVALLVAILLPGLAEARRAGKQVKNVVNLKGMGAASQSYASEHKDAVATLNRALLSANNRLINPLSDWGRTRTFRTEAQGGRPFDGMSVDVVDRMIALSGGVSNQIASERGTFNPFARYYPVLLASHLSAKLPDPSYVNPLDRVRNLIIGDTPEFLRAPSLGRWGLPNFQTVFCFSSSYQTNWAHIQLDRGLGNGRDGQLREGEEGPTEVVGPWKRIFAQRRVSDVLSPSDKIFMFDRVARQTGRTPLPFSHPASVITDAFWDSSVRTTRTSESNPGGWVFGPASRRKVDPAASCIYIENPAEGDDLWPDPIYPPALRASIGGDIIHSAFGYHKWTVDGLRGRDVNGRQPPPGNL